MAKEETNTKKSPRELLLERASAKYPDRKFSGQVGQDGQEGTDDLEQAIIEMLDASDARIAEDDSKNAELVRLFSSSPESVEFLQEWVRSGDPAAALVKVFGDRISDLSTEEGRAAYEEEYKSWKDKADAESGKREEMKANYQKSLEDLNSWGDEKGLSLDEKSQVMVRLFDIVANALDNAYRPEDFDLVYKEMNYDSAVEAARKEGEVAGRNEKIAEARRSRNAATAMPPTMSGQGIRSEEKKPAKPKSVWSDLN